MSPDKISVPAIHDWHLLQALRDLVLGREEATRYQANVDVSKVAERLEENEAATRYVFARVEELCRDNGMELLLVMDGDRRSIQKRLPSDALYEAGVLRLNRSAAGIAAELGIAFIDLHPVFEADFALHGKAFRFEHDGHWTEHAHAVAADAIAGHLREDGWARKR